MPSFDAPIRIDQGPDWTWSAAEISLTVLGAGAVTVAVLSTLDAALAVALAALVGGVGARHAVGVWRDQRRANPVCLWLQADGELRGTLADGATVLAREVVIEASVPGLLILRGQRVAAGSPRRRLRVRLTRHALAPDVLRRLCAWHRAGLPLPLIDPDHREGRR